MLSGWSSVGKDEAKSLMGPQERSKGGLVSRWRPEEFIFLPVVQVNWLTLQKPAKEILSEQTDTGFYSYFCCLMIVSFALSIFSWDSSYKIRCLVNHGTFTFKLL